MKLTVDQKPNNLETLYRKAVDKFSQSNYISTAKIQRELKVPYSQADSILNRMIKEKFASTRIGSWPCRVIKGKFKDAQIIKATLTTHLWIKTGYHPDQKEFLR